jgi:hypothetical protein
MLDLFTISGAKGLHFTLESVINESLITRARNRLTDTFLNSDSDYLFFIDGDIGFNPLDVLYTVQLAATNDDMKIIAAAYPQKGISWKNIKQAQELGLIDSQLDYAQYSGEFGVNFLEKTIFNLEEPVKVSEASTGFMLIKREVLEQFAVTYPHTHFVQHEDSSPSVAYFDTGIDPKTKLYMSEDYMFCLYAKDMGVSTWLLPWVNLTHRGSYTYDGNFTTVSKMTAEIYRTEY